MQKVADHLSFGPTGDLFGYDVSISGNGNVIVVSAIGEQSTSSFYLADQNNNAFEKTGAVYIFEKNIQNSWEQIKYIKPSNAISAIYFSLYTIYGDTFGTSISLSDDGNLLAVGAPGEDSSSVSVNGDDTDNSLIQSGATYTYNRDISGNWTFNSYIKSSNPNGNISAGSSFFGDNFGNTVDLSSDGNKLAVSATGEAGGADIINGDLTDNSATNAGAVYLY